jgi:prophage regulatory protein
MTTSILRLPDVIKRTGLSRSSIYLRIKNNQFPRQISLGVKAVGWVESEIQEWIDQHIAMSRQK